MLNNAPPPEAFADNRAGSCWHHQVYLCTTTSPFGKGQIYLHPATTYIDSYGKGSYR